MTYLILSILCSTAIYAVFKLFAKYEVENVQAIVTNYLVAAGFGYFYAYQQDMLMPVFDQPWLPNALTVGALFISLFYLMAIISQQIGVSVASVSTKMAMVIPVVFFIAIDTNEVLTISKVIGVLLGLGAVYLATLPTEPGGNTSKNRLMLPLILFVGSGILDVVLAYSEKMYLASEAAFLSFVPSGFFFAGIAGSIWLLIRIIRGQSRLNAKSIFGGVILGLINYGSIYFLLKTLASGMFDRSTVFPINNMGIVALSTVMGFVIFSEKLSRKNTIGITLAIIAIAVLTWGDIGL